MTGSWRSSSEDVRWHREADAIIAEQVAGNVLSGLSSEVIAT
jgi:hypothetical protein